MCCWIVGSRAKVIWRTARERDFLITTGLKSNRSLRIEDEAEPKGWRWQPLSEYAASLTAEQYVVKTWPCQSSSIIPRAVSYGSAFVARIEKAHLDGASRNAAIILPSVAKASFGVITG